MRIALVNPPWSYEGSIYFGCREPHLPLELGCAATLLGSAGHEILLIDAQLEGLDDAGVRARVAPFAPEMTVVTTAPTYLFWRCPPPELRIPLGTIAQLRDVAGALVAVGPHASTTPRATIAKLGVDAAILGECEEVLVRLAATPRADWGDVESVAIPDGDGARVNGSPAAADLATLPPLRWSDALLARHGHHHHRFDTRPDAPGGELEATRGCPYNCSFCNKENFRNRYRKRPLATVLTELDGLLAQGVRYVYFVDEIFLPDRPLLEALAARDVSFGVQLRVDNWEAPMLDLLGAAGCVSIEAGVESITTHGRSLLAKNCKRTTEELTDRLIYAKRRIPFVQANLLAGDTDDPDEVERWRIQLQREGVWANKPVPLFQYPGTPSYRQRWGLPDDRAWERAHADYLARWHEFSDIQEASPVPLDELEGRSARRA